MFISLGQTVERPPQIKSDDKSLVFMYKSVPKSLTEANLSRISPALGT